MLQLNRCLEGIRLRGKYHHVVRYHERLCSTEVTVSTKTAPQMLEYPNFHGEGTSRLVYVVLPDRRCIFSGVTRRGTSTINRAEAIIDLIAQREEIDPFTCRWFDLQTYLQYGGESWCPHPGEFEFDELILCPNDHRTQDRVIEADEMTVSIGGSPEAFTVDYWKPTPCPPEIVAVFREYIGDHSRPAFQCKNPSDPDPNRLHGLAAEIRDMDEELLPLFEKVEQLGRTLRPGRDDIDAGCQPEFEQAWGELRAYLLKGRRVHPQTVVSLETTMTRLHRWGDLEFLQRHLLKMHPSNPETLIMLGSTMITTGRPVEAEECYMQAIDSLRRALRQRKHDLEVLLSVHPDVARRRTSKVDHLIADTASAFCHLAEAQIRSGRLQEAIESARHANHLYTIVGFAYSEPWRLIGEAQIRLGNLAAAQPSLERCLQIHHEDRGDFAAQPERVARVLEAMRNPDVDLVALLNALDNEELVKE